MNFWFLTLLSPRTGVPLFGGGVKISYSVCCVWIWTQVRGNHLAEVVRSKPGRRTYGDNATYPPILAFLGLFAHPTPRG